MLKKISIQIMMRIRERFQRLYGDRSEQCVERLEMLVGRYGVGLDGNSYSAKLDETTVILITYGDTVQKDEERPLKTLKHFVDQHVRESISAVHILPFYPFSSDDGFSVIDYREVREDLGTWSDVSALGENFTLMFDLVLNHTSRKSRWFRDYVSGIAPARFYFEEADPSNDLSAVVRPRSSPLLTKTQTRLGERHVWTTFSSDQIDLDFSNPDVLFEFLDILLYYVAHGVRIIRLDAVAFLWKKVGTSCLHLPETHEVVKLLRDFLEMVAPGVVLITETNVPHEENVSYFGSGDEAHMVYQFSLPPLLLYSLLRGNAETLIQWASALEDPPASCTYFNFCASHDGIGVRPLQGLVADSEIDWLVDEVQARGGRVSKKQNSDGSESPYELNITYFDALSDPRADDPDAHVARFLCSQSVLLTMRGVPGIYFHSLTATPNNLAEIQETGRARTINRKKWNLEMLEALLADQSSQTHRVFQRYIHMLNCRRAHPAFHPVAEQSILDLGPDVFAILRNTPGGSQRVLALHNFTANRVEVGPIPGLNSGSAWDDLLDSGKAVDLSQKIELRPYKVKWLANS